MSISDGRRNQRKFGPQVSISSAFPLFGCRRELETLDSHKKYSEQENSNGNSHSNFILQVLEFERGLRAWHCLTESRVSYFCFRDFS